MLLNYHQLDQTSSASTTEKWLLENISPLIDGMTPSEWNSMSPSDYSLYLANYDNDDDESIDDNDEWDAAGVFA